MSHLCEKITKKVSTNANVWEQYSRFAVAQHKYEEVLIVSFLLCQACILSILLTSIFFFFQSRLLNTRRSKFVLWNYSTLFMMAPSFSFLLLPILICSISLWNFCLRFSLCNHHPPLLMFQIARRLHRHQFYHLLLPHRHLLPALLSIKIVMIPVKCFWRWNLTLKAFCIGHNSPTLIILLSVSWRTFIRLHSKNGMKWSAARRRLLRHPLLVILRWYFWRVNPHCGDEVRMISGFIGVWTEPELDINKQSQRRKRGSYDSFDCKQTTCITQGIKSEKRASGTTSNTWIKRWRRTSGNREEDEPDTTQSPDFQCKAHKKYNEAVIAMRSSVEERVWAVILWLSSTKESERVLVVRQKTARQLDEKQRRATTWVKKNWRMQKKLNWRKGRMLEGRQQTQRVELLRYWRRPCLHLPP